MKIIGILNAASFVLILFGVIVLTRKLYKNFRFDGSLILIIISFCVLLLVTFTNVLEHLNITNYFDLFEDDIEILFIPLFIFAVFSYCLKKELKENKKKEQSNKESNLRLNTSVKGANQALWEWYPQNNSIVINKEYCYLDFDLLYNRISTENWRDIVHPDSETTFNNLIDTLKSGVALPENIELKLKTVSGSYEWVLMRGARANLTFENQDITYLGTIIDIGNFKNVQFELEISKLKAEESERLKTAFLNNISHEIRTPMNAIVGFTDLIIEPGIAPEKQKKYMTMIVQGCERLIRIIDDLIEMSKIVAGIVHLNIKPINAKLFCEKLLDVYSKKSAVKGIKLSAYYSSDLLFNSDEDKLIVIFNNLLDNAIKYTNEGSIEFGINKADNKLQFYVTDTGLGIDKKYQNSIFEYFKKIEISASQFHTGSGLGLSICKGLVTAMNGEINIDSEPEKGTTVYFTLPYNEPLQDEGLQTLKNVKESLNKKFKILIAEDEESNFQYLREILSSKIETILWAKTGEEVINIFDSNRDVSLILMDLKMPVIDGCEAASRIKKIDPTIPIIAQTAYSLVSDSGLQIDNIFDNYLTKPIRRETLFHTLNQYLFV